MGNLLQPQEVNWYMIAFPLKNGILRLNECELSDRLFCICSLASWGKKWSRCGKEMSFSVVYQFGEWEDGFDVCVFLTERRFKACYPWEVESITNILKKIKHAFSIHPKSQFILKNEWHCRHHIRIKTNLTSQSDICFDGWTRILRRRLVSWGLFVQTFEKVCQCLRGSLIRPVGGKSTCIFLEQFATTSTTIWHSPCPPY